MSPKPDEAGRPQEKDQAAGPAQVAQFSALPVRELSFHLTKTRRY